MSKYRYHDGGRTRQGTSSDCVVRALAIATGKKYDTVYRWLEKDMIEWYGSQGFSETSVRCWSKPGVGKNGVGYGHSTEFLHAHGWYRTRVTMVFGESTVAEVANIYKDETVIITSKTPRQRKRGHMCCAKRGVVLDTWDCRESRAITVWRKR